MKCDHCTRPASQEYPIDGEWYPVCDVCAPEFGGLRPLTTPHSILQQAQEAVADRQDRYGDCTEVFSITAEMFNAYRRGRKGATGAQDTAVFNICQKLARISCGQGHRDNWVDIAGYADRGAEVSDE